MERGNRVLPLFPLNTVLFPDAAMPLRIFEERYKLMVQRCIEADSEFGVVLIRSGFELGAFETRSVGTVARIFDVRRLGDGQMRIAVAGRERFRIETVTRRLPYMEGWVTILDEGPAAISQDEMEAVRRTAAAQVRLIHGLAGGWVRDPKLPEEPVALSYFIAALLRVDNAEKQSVLEESSTAERLRMELRLLERDRATLQERVARKLGEGSG